MADGRIYINSGEQPNQVVMDFSRSPSAALVETTWYGFGLSRTLKHLGITSLRGPDFGRLTLEGHLAEVQARVPILDGKIGKIAARGAELDRASKYRSFYDLEPILRRKLEGLVTHLSQLDIDTPFDQACGSIVYPFAEEGVSDNNSLWLVPNRVAPWVLEAQQSRKDDLAAFLEMVPAARALQNGPNPER